MLHKLYDKINGVNMVFVSKRWSKIYFFIPFKDHMSTKNTKYSSIILEHQQVSKGGFSSESAIRFSDLQIKKKKIPKNYPELEI